jgi:transposase
MSRKHFSKEFKLDSISYALAHADRSVTTLAQELGVGYSTLDKWLRDHREAGGAARELTAEQKN